MPPFWGRHIHLPISKSHQGVCFRYYTTFCMVALPSVEVALKELIISRLGKHQSAGRKTLIRGEENANSRKERSNLREERI